KDVGGVGFFVGRPAVDLHGVSVGVILGGGRPVHLAGCGCAFWFEFCRSFCWLSVGGCLARTFCWGSCGVRVSGLLAVFSGSFAHLLICSLLGCRWLWGSVRVPLSSVCGVQVLGAGAGARWGGRVRVGDYLPPWSGSAGAAYRY